MPRVTGGVNHKTGKCWNDTYEHHPITDVGLNSALKASSWQNMKKCAGGHNGAAIEARIDYMRQAINVGLVETACIPRAIRTIKSMEAMLCEAL